MCLILSPSDFNLFTLVLKFKHVPKCSAGCRPRQIVDLGAELHKVSALLDWSSMGPAGAVQVWDAGRGQCSVSQLHQVLGTTDLRLCSPCREHPNSVASKQVPEFQHLFL